MKCAERNCKTHQAKLCLISLYNQKNSHRFSVGDRQDGETLYRPWEAPHILVLAVGWKTCRLSLKFADLTLSFGGGSSTKFADRVCEPFFKGAHRAPGAWGAGGRAAWCLWGQRRHGGGDAALTACCRIRVWRKGIKRQEKQKVTGEGKQSIDKG